MRAELAEKGVSEVAQDAVLELAKISSPDASFVEAVAAAMEREMEGERERETAN